MQRHLVLVGVCIACQVVLVEIHLVGVLVYFVLVLIVEAEVVQEVNQQLTWVGLVPLGYAGKQHDHQSVGLKTAILWLA